MTDYPIQPSGDNNFQSTDPNAREMKFRGLDYNKAKASLENLYNNAEDTFKTPYLRFISNKLLADEKQRGIKLMSPQITHIYDTYGSDGTLDMDDCNIEFVYGKKDKELLFDKIRYSQLIIFPGEMELYGASKNDKISCPSIRSVEDISNWKESGKKEKAVHKMAQIQIEDKLDMHPAAVLRTIAEKHKEPEIARILFTGLKLFEDERYHSGIEFKSGRTPCPIAIVSYIHKQRDGKEISGKFTIDEHLF